MVMHWVTGTPRSIHGYWLYVFVHVYCEQAKARHWPQTLFKSPCSVCGNYLVYGFFTEPEYLLSQRFFSPKKDRLDWFLVCVFIYPAKVLSNRICSSSIECWLNRSTNMTPTLAHIYIHFVHRVTCQYQFDI